MSIVLLLATLLALAVPVFFSLIAEPLTGLVDTAFVATHHIVRITVVVMIVPFLFKLMRNRGLID